MAVNINYPDYTKAPLLDTPATDLFENLLKGYKMGREPANMAAAEKKNALANQLSQLEAEHKPKEYALNDEQKRLANSLSSKANAHYEEKYGQEKELRQANIDKAKRPGGSGDTKFNSTVANADKIWRIEHPDGANTPELQADYVKTLKDAFALSQDRIVSGIHRTEKLNETQNDRAPRSPVERIHYELASYDKGERPYTHEKISSEEQSKGKNDLLLDIVKKTTDPATRTKLQNGLNMNITLDEVEPKKLVQYSGIMKQGDKLADFVEEQFGSGSEKYKDYQRQVNKAAFAAKQMRQYLGDSIQPTAQQRLEHLTNPEDWNVTPSVAEDNFNFMRNLMKRETNTLIRAATDPSIYQAQKNENNPSTDQSSNLFDWNKYPVAGRK